MLYIYIYCIFLVATPEKNGQSRKKKKGVSEC